MIKPPSVKQLIRSHSAARYLMVNDFVSRTKRVVTGTPYAGSLASDAREQMVNKYA